MARHTGPKNKLQRRIGEDLGLKTNALKVAKRIRVRPGQHGHRMVRKLSNYGVQLKEKKKIQYIYGILAKQLRRLYQDASHDPTATGEALLSLLERRLDNVVYRLGFAPTRAAARQLVTHNHVLVNNKKMNIPSYRVQEKDVISLKKKALKIPAVKQTMENEGIEIPVWLERKAHIGTVKALPEREHIQERIDEQLVVEFYSR